MEPALETYDLTIAVNDLTVSYDESGSGSIPVIFLHGFPFDKTMWRQQLESLKSVNRVIAYDIRGFGKTKDEQSLLSIDLFGDDLIGFMDALGIEKAVLCGLSMGGYIALNVVKRFPDRVAALILCDTQCVADTIDVRKKRLKTIEAIGENGTADFSKGFIKSIFHPDSITNKRDVVRGLKRVVDANSVHIIQEGMTALATRTETCSALADINVPTLIMCGRQDTVTPLEKSEYLNTNIKGSKLRVIENAGHVSNLEQGEVFNKHVRDFLSPFGYAQGD
jgi:3-oxoadipate enol-lactonase